MSITFYEICRNYSDSVARIDTYMEAVCDKYNDAVNTIVANSLFNESYDDYALMEAKVEYKLEAVEKQMAEKTAKSQDGLIQAFLNFVKNLGEKIKEFFRGKKFEEVKDTIEKDPEVANKVIDGVVDEKVLRAVLKEREKLAKKIVEDYRRMGAKLNVDELDDLITQKQVELNKKIIASKKKQRCGNIVKTIAWLASGVVNVALFKSLSKGVKSCATTAGENLTKPLTKGEIGSTTAKAVAGTVGTVLGVTGKAVAGAAVVGSGVSAASDVAKTVKVQKMINELERQNKLLMSNQIQELTKQCTAAAMKKSDDRHAVKDAAKAEKLRRKLGGKNRNDINDTDTL